MGEKEEEKQDQHLGERRGAHTCADMMHKDDRLWVGLGWDGVDWLSYWVRWV